MSEAFTSYLFEDMQMWIDEAIDKLAMFYKVETYAVA
jgi:hypothetical protein